MNVVTTLSIYVVSLEITDCKDEKINTGTPTTCASIFRNGVKQSDTIETRFIYAFSISLSSISYTLEL